MRIRNALVFLVFTMLSSNVFALGSHYAWDRYGDCNQYTPAGVYMRTASEDFCE